MGWRTGGVGGRGGGHSLAEADAEKPQVWEGPQHGLDFDQVRQRVHGLQLPAVATDSKSDV